jgi:hypothetical protein
VEGIERYVRDRESRLQRLRDLVGSIERGHGG